MSTNSFRPDFHQYHLAGPLLAELVTLLSLLVSVVFVQMTPYFIPSASLHLLHSLISLMSVCFFLTEDIERSKLTHGCEQFVAVVPLNCI